MSTSGREQTSSNPRSNERARSISSSSTERTLPVEFVASLSTDEPPDCPGPPPNVSQDMDQIQILPAGDWVTDTENALANPEEYKAKIAGQQHWRERKNELKRYLAIVKSDAVARKFEIDIKVIGK